MRPALKYSILTIGAYLILVPLHELGHIAVANLQGLHVVSTSLFSLFPNVVVAETGTIAFFLAGPAVALVPVSITFAYYWKRREYRFYFYALIITMLLGDIGDFGATLHLMGM